MASAAARTNATEHYFVHFTGRFELYFTPALVVFGTLGNLLSICVFYKSKLRTHTTSQYLTALAVSDTLFLLQLLPAWLNTVRVSGIFHTDGPCQLFEYTSYVCSFLSSWLVVAFTVERFVAVLYPLRRTRVFTQSRVRWIIGALVAAALVFNLPVLKFAMAYPNNCEPNVEYYVHAARFNLIDTIFTFSVPLLVIVVLNGWIAGGVVRLQRARSQLHAASGAHDPRSQQRVTRMLLTVSSVFVLLNLPAYTMRIYFYANEKYLVPTYNGTATDEDSNSTQLNSPIHSVLAAQSVASLFFNTNFGINFLLFCLSGQNFRQALRQVIHRSSAMENQGAIPRKVRSLPPTPKARSTIAVEQSQSGQYLEVPRLKEVDSPPLRKHRQLPELPFNIREGNMKLTRQNGIKNRLGREAHERARSATGHKDTAQATPKGGGSTVPKRINPADGRGD